MNSFISPEDAALAERLLADGYVIEIAESPDDLAAIRKLCANVAGDADLDAIHGRIGPKELNDLKLEVMAAMNIAAWTRGAYFRLAQNLLYALIGNELAMQKKFNLNIQMPGDELNTLPRHADTWTGDSPYQLVLWVPLTDCYGTKAMYMETPAGEKTIDIKYGEVLLFNPTLPHGNRVNTKNETRWSLNCRFKSVWSPYGVKRLGEHFEPITLRAASRIGMGYKHPVVV